MMNCVEVASQISTLMIKHHVDVDAIMIVSVQYQEIYTLSDTCHCQ